MADVLDKVITLGSVVGGEDRSRRVCTVYCDGRYSF